MRCTEHVARLGEIRNANKMWLCKPLCRCIGQKNIKTDIIETVYEGTGLVSSNAGNVNLQDFADTVVLYQVASKETFWGQRSICQGFKETESLLDVTG
jgi:hypothetical protein